MWLGSRCVCLVVAKQVVLLYWPHPYVIDIRVMASARVAPCGVCYGTSNMTHCGTMPLCETQDRVMFGIHFVVSSLV